MKRLFDCFGGFGTERIILPFYEGVALLGETAFADFFFYWKLVMFICGFSKGISSKRRF